jgi:hypothetical protein
MKKTGRPALNMIKHGTYLRELSKLHEPMYLIKRILILAAFIMPCRGLYAQSVYAQVSSKQVQAGDPFEYAIVANANISGISPPNFAGFSVISGPNQSSSMQWVNGQTTMQLTISWQLVAQKEGKFNIGKAIVAIGNQRYETNAVSIEVTKGAPAPTGTDNNKTISGGDIFIRTNVSKSKCYLGEQVTITQKVYSRLQIVGFQKFSQPAYDGFYSIAQESASKGQLAVENVDGVNFYTYEIFRSVAIANKTGKISLTPVDGEVIIRKAGSSKPKNIFEQFFGASSYEDVPVPLKSRQASVEVMPLPEDGRPASFGGAVGDFSYKVLASRNELKANDAFNLKLTITGKGNIKLIAAPKLTLPESFEAYDPKISENGNSKTFDYLIIPRHEGDYKLDNLNFSYFNPDTKRYVTLPSGELTIKVLPADPNTSGAQVYIPRSDIRETENDIRYIKKGDLALTKSNPEFFNSYLHMSLMMLPVLALLAGLFIRRKQIELNRDVALVRERKAGKTARRQLERAEKLMRSNSKEPFYTEILAAIYNYTGNKLNIPAAEISRDRLMRSLQTRHVDKDLTDRLFATIDTGEYAKYAPGAVSGDLEGVYKNTVQLITELEQHLNKRT